MRFSLPRPFTDRILKLCAFSVCSIALLFLINLLYKTAFSPHATPIAQAGIEHNVKGWAWSDNVGWISLNSLNCDANGDGIYDSTPVGCPPVGAVAPNHGVHVSFITGIITGFGWNDTVGWIDFAPTTGFPELPLHGARMDITTGRITGWIRTLTTGDGFDGWIKLLGDSTGTGPVGCGPGAVDHPLRLNFANGQLSGFAWGSLVVGWVCFDVVVNLPPIALDDDASTHEFDPPFIDIPVLANDSDPEGDSLFIVLVTPPANGTISIVVVGGVQQIRYTRNVGFFGVDRFTYTITDGRGNQASAKVDVNVFECGDNIMQKPWEQCDGPDFGGATCRDFNTLFVGGDLVCRPDCTVDLGQCRAFPEMRVKEI